MPCYNYPDGFDESLLDDQESYLEIAEQNTSFFDRAMEYLVENELISEDDYENYVSSGKISDEANKAYIENIDEEFAEAWVTGH